MNDKPIDLEQPAPKRNEHPAIWDLVIADMVERHRVGCARYGTALQPFNGRNALVDAYAEVLDMAVYLRQRIYEDERIYVWSTMDNAPTMRPILLKDANGFVALCCWNLDDSDQGHWRVKGTYGYNAYTIDGGPLLFKDPIVWAEIPT